MTVGRGTRFKPARYVRLESIIGRPHISGRHEYYEEIFRCKPPHELTRWCMNAPARDGVRHSTLNNAGAVSLRFAKKCPRAITGSQRTWLALENFCFSRRRLSCLWWMHDGGTLISSINAREIGTYPRLRCLMRSTECSGPSLNSRVYTDR